MLSELTVKVCSFVPLRNVAPSGAVTVNEFGFSPRLLPIIEKSIHVTGSSSGMVRVIGVMAPAAMVLFTVVVSEFDWYPFSSKAVKRIVPLTVVGQRKTHT